MLEIFKYLFDILLKLFEFIYYNLAFKDLGLAIIFLTILIRLILLPIFYKNTKDQLKMLKIKPEIEKIQKEYKDDKQKLGLALMEVYQKNKINPFSSFLLIIIQIPILIALYRLFSYEISNLGFDNLNFLGLINLKENNLFLAFLAGLTQYWQTKIMFKMSKTNSLKNEKENEINKNNINDFKEIFNKSLNHSSLYFMPLFTFLILNSLPSGLGLYWTVSNIFSVGQQYFVYKKL